MRFLVPTVSLLLLLSLLPACAPRGSSVSVPRDPAELPVEATHVEVIRTAYGVPHVYAENFRALGYALGYLQMEDYGDRVPLILLGARGELARHQGVGAIDADFASLPYYLRAVETYALIDRDTRDVYEGFAIGVNHYMARNRREFPSWTVTFDGHDVAAAYVYRTGQNTIRRWMRRLTGEEGLPADSDEPDGFDVGSSAWALAPGRTTSGVPILLRNPHLSWSAGYWEAHIVIPGRLDFYGDFRIGGPIGIVGGFNRHLAFATTNNDVNTSEVYALDADPERTDRYTFDGVPVPLDREPITISYRSGNREVSVTRERLTTRLGPVLHRDHDTIYVLRDAEDGIYRGGDQFLRMMQARSLDEWKAAMRLQAHPGSNFVYADTAGNILFLWNGAVPVRPHPAGGDRPVRASRTSDIWTTLHALDELPQILNPPGGYVRNENDPPWRTNLRRPLVPEEFPDYFEVDAPLSLRSQHSALLLDNERRFSLEDVVELKHSDRMLLADRVKDDLIAAVRAAGALGSFAGEERTAITDTVALLRRWDNTAGAESRGAVLFAEWWRLYEESVDGDPFAVSWSPADPLGTPRGLARPELAAARFADAVRDTAARFGSADVAWGEVHRVRRGRIDEPAHGCPGVLGCFRVLNFEDTADGRRTATGGDGWVLAVELTNPPRAYSVLAYGQSNKADSSHHDDQAALFARGEMKRVAYERDDVERGAERRYRPGTD